MASKNSAWIAQVGEKLATTTGHFSALDTDKKTISLDWELIAGNSPRLTAKIRLLSECFVYAYTEQELEFAHACPGEVKDEHFLKSLAPLFGAADAAVNWDLVQLEIRNIFENFFATTDFVDAQSGDLHIFVVAKDADGRTCGAIQFFVTPQDPVGSVKAAMFGVLPAGQNRGIDKLLMSSIFKLLPETDRLFLHTRKTAVRAIERYHKWGFTPFTGPLEKWLDLEYLVDGSSVLQNVAGPIEGWSR